MEGSKKIQQVAIGYDVTTDWLAMNVAGQRILRWNVYFEEDMDSADYCGILADLWEPFLTRCGLCAGIVHPFPENPRPWVMAWVWRQYHLGAQLRLGSISSDEIRALADLTRASTPELFRWFFFFELDSTDRAGDHRKVRMQRYKNGEFVISGCDDKPTCSA